MDVAGDRSKQVRVLVFHAELLIADALAAGLKGDSDLRVVGVETDPARALGRAFEIWPDVVLVQYGVEGRQLTGTLCAELPDARVVMVISSADEDVLLACAQAGAIGYVTRQQSLDDMLVAIRRASKGDILFEPPLLRRLLVHSRPVSGPMSPGDEMERLSPRELDVLQVLATGVRTEDAAAQLCITDHTLRSHLRKLMEKLGAHSRLEAVMLALRAGVIQLPHEVHGRPALHHEMATAG